METGRRKFIQSGLLAAAGLMLPRRSFGSGVMGPAGNGSMDISIFSKNLQWLSYEDMAAAAAELGFDGVDLTVRPEGHVLPERVSDDLPRAAAAIRKNGLKLNTIVTAITDAGHIHTEAILKTASGLGVSGYRLGWIHYDDTLSIPENLARIVKQLEALDALNMKYNIEGSYQNHSGLYFGAAVWDLAQALQAAKAQRTGSQYDVYHATIEGANAWAYGFQLITPYIKNVNIKDFQWAKKEARWRTESVPLGSGQVDFKKYFGLLKASGLRVPFSLHYEYPLGGADQGRKTVTMSRNEIFTFMKKDLMFLRNAMKESGLE